MLESRLGDLLSLGKRKRRKLSRGSEHHDAVRPLFFQVSEHVLVELSIEVQALVAGRRSRHPKHLFFSGCSRHAARVWKAAVGLGNGRFSNYPECRCRAYSSKKCSSRSLYHGNLQKLPEV